MNEQTDHHDRLIDQALTETIGSPAEGSGPPDLADGILAACAEQTPQPPLEAKPSRRRYLTWAVAASLLFCLGALARPGIDAAREQVGLRFVDLPTGSTGELVEEVRERARGEEIAADDESKDGTDADPFMSGLTAGFENVQGLASTPEREEKAQEWIGSLSESGDGQVAPLVYPDAESWNAISSRKEGYKNNPSAPSKSPANGQQGPRRSATVGVGVNSDSGVVGQIMINEESRQLSSLSSKAQPQRWDFYAKDNQPEYLGQAQVNSNYSVTNGVTPLSNSDFGTNSLRGYAGLPGKSGESPHSRYRGFDFTDGRGSANGPPRAYWGYNGAQWHRWPEFTADFDLPFRGESSGVEGFALGEQGRGPGRSGDRYLPIYENPFMEAKGIQALSTFSIDVDTASYSNVRKFLSSGQLPPADAVRLEELVNYFDYQYAGPSQGQTPTPGPSPKGGGEKKSGPSSQETAKDMPFAAHVEVAACPWQPAHKLVRIGVKGRELEEKQRPLTNLVFLIDVSGSMQDRDKLPLVVEGMKALTRQLGENDRVAIVVYASQEGLALESTPGDQQQTILAALDSLTAGGSTAGGAGIQLAYQMAEDHFIKGGVNRVILCTDGDFNVGTTSTAELEEMVEKKAKDTGVFLSVCGFGRGNLNDAMMETISGKGNGNYFYVDSPKEAEKVFVKGLSGTLVTIAKDVKIQVEFNPQQVAGYRLLGYENRMLQAQDFNDDKKDAGEIGAGHRVTALYEIVPAGQKVPAAKLDDLRYQKPAESIDQDVAEEMLVLKMRWKAPDGDTSTKREWPIAGSDTPFAKASEDFQFATAAAGFGMLLRNSQYRGDLTWDAVIEIARGAKSHDPEGYRAEMIELATKAKRLHGEYVAQVNKQAKDARYQQALDELERVKKVVEKLQKEANK